MTPRAAAALCVCVPVCAGRVKASGPEEAQKEEA